jgi:hypothetical protein
MKLRIDEDLLLIGSILALALARLVFDIVKSAPAPVGATWGSTSMVDRSVVLIVATLLLVLAIAVFIVTLGDYLFQPMLVQWGAPSMIGLFIKSGRGWFCELMFWLLILELARLIGG